MASATPKVRIISDGAHSGSTGKGGYCALLEHGPHKLIVYGDATDTTNNRMELTAAVVAMEQLTDSAKVELVSDSKHVLDGIRRLDGWKRSGWCRADGKPLANRDLWERMDTQAARHSIVTKWVKGHNGHRENELADNFARREAGTL